MSKKCLMREYKRSLNDIKDYSKQLGIGEDQFEEMFNECIKTLENDQPINKHVSRFNISRGIRIACVFILTILALYLINIFFDDKPLSVMLCKIQEFIYPGLRLLRIMSIPIISTFPSLTELYDETCLIQNPLFQIDDMDCWPCHSINQIHEITSTSFDPQSSPPFIFQAEQKLVTFADLKNVYDNNQKVFDKDAPKILVNSEETILAAEFFRKYNLTNEVNTSKSSYLWRLNRMFPAQLVRALFPRPSIVPRLGLSTERFVTFNEAKADTYKLPDPECNYVFVIQGQGERLIEFRPARECLQYCNSVSIRLPPSFLLWYNWWYWRPVSHPTDSNSSSISYIGSYC